MSSSASTLPDYVRHIESCPTEVVDLEIRIDKIKYRYHYQEIETDERIFRYDNVKHHPSLPTFPHHKHCGPEKDSDMVIASAEKSLAEILEEIENLLHQKNIL